MRFTCTGSSRGVVRLWAAGVRAVGSRGRARGARVARRQRRFRTGPRPDLTPTHLVVNNPRLPTLLPGFDKFSRSHSTVPPTRARNHDRARETERPLAPPACPCFLETMSLASCPTASLSASFQLLSAAFATAPTSPVHASIRFCLLMSLSRQHRLPTNRGTEAEESPAEASASLVPKPDKGQVPTTRGRPGRDRARGFVAEAGSRPTCRPHVEVVNWLRDGRSRAPSAFDSGNQPLLRTFSRSRVQNPLFRRLCTLSGQLSTPTSPSTHYSTFGATASVPAPSSQPRRRRRLPASISPTRDRKSVV